MTDENKRNVGVNKLICWLINFNAFDDIEALPGIKPQTVLFFYTESTVHICRWLCYLDPRNHVLRKMQLKYFL